MDSKDETPKADASSGKKTIRNAVQQMRPDDKEETIMRPATNEEVKEAVEEINPDVDNTMDRG